MALTTFNGFIAQVGALKTLTQPLYGEIQTATNTLFAYSAAIVVRRIGDTKALPNPLPSGITGYIVTQFSCAGNVATTTSFQLVRLINLGEINLQLGFTDGSAMPTVTELGVSRATSSPIFCAVTTALNSAPGSIAITYTDQDGNTGQTSTTEALTASSVVQSGGMPRLASGDWGVRDITNITQSGGTSPTGVVKCWGIIPLGMVPSVDLPGSNHVRNHVTDTLTHFRLGAGDQLGILQYGTNSTGMIVGDITVIGE